MKKEMPKKIFVVGLGNMGFALANTLLLKGYRLTVWNRTRSKAQPLIEQGAFLAESVAEGISNNDVIVICLGNYQDSINVFDQCASFSGKTLIQLTTASGEEATDMQNWVQQKDGLYLDGAILAFPSGVGSQEGRLLVAGRQEAWAGGEEVVKALGPASQYMGDNVAGPAALDFALIFPSLALMMSVIQGIHTLEGTGVSTETYVEMIAPIFGSLGPIIRQMAQKIEAQEFSDTEASLGVWQSAIEHPISSFKREGKNLDLVDAVNVLLKRGVASGLGSEDLTALIKHLRKSVS
jgi:3-hydroxyisobutyrate dehydrogenase-like beta-hydroxyacid dehydrogenase